jgi:hypothetical protein
VCTVAFAPCPPLAGACEVTGVRRVGDGPLIDYGDMEGILTYEVSAGYFETLGVPVREGRVFDDALGRDDPPLAVVNEAAARHLFGGAALGDRISVTHPLTDEVQAEVIGVVADVREGALETPVMPALYLPRAQAPRPYGALIVGVDGDPYAVLDGVRAASAALDPTLPLTDPTTVAELTAAATARTRVLVGLLAAFALLGLLLSAVGVYGVVSYDVLRRTREMGLRVALGASTGDVLRGVALRPALFAAAGVGVGVAAALLLTERASGLLYGVRAGDPRVLAAASAVLLLVTVIAAWLPARRALAVDPAETLRGD